MCAEERLHSCLDRRQSFVCGWCIYRRVYPKEYAHWLIRHFRCFCHIISYVSVSEINHFAAVNGLSPWSAIDHAWWLHQIETFSALLAICAGNSSVIGEFPAQRPVVRSFDVSFDLLPNKWVSKQWWGWWFETPSCLLWRQCNGLETMLVLNSINVDKIQNEIWMKIQ